MNLRTVLFKSLVKTFYQANAGFFLVVVFMGFGFLKTPQHMDIGRALAYNPIYYLIVLVPWTLYALKTLRYCKSQRRLAAFQFLSYLDSLPRPRRLWLVMTVQLALLAPTLLYSLMLIGVAIKEGLWISVVLVVLGNLTILVIAGFRLEKLITEAVDPGAAPAFSHWTNKLPKTLPMLYVHQLFNRQAILLIGTKVLSLALVFGFIMIYDMDSTDLRLVSLGLLLSTGINSILAFYYRQFEYTQMRVFRNLPLSADSRFIGVMLTFLILSLPEILVLYLNGVLSMPLTFLLKNALLPLSLLCFFHSFCYARSLNVEQFAKVPFFSVAILFFVILGHVDVLYISAVLLLVSWLVYRKVFSRFELAHSD